MCAYGPGRFESDTNIIINVFIIIIIFFFLRLDKTGGHQENNNNNTNRLSLKVSMDMCVAAKTLAAPNPPRAC